MTSARGGYVEEDIVEGGKRREKSNPTPYKCGVVRGV